MGTATRTKKRTESKRSDGDQAIRPGDGFLPLPVFLQKTRQGSHAWMMAKRRARSLGITLAYQHGRQIFVSADDWIQYLKSNPAPLAEPRHSDERPEPEVTAGVHQ